MNSIIQLHASEQPFLFKYTDPNIDSVCLNPLQRPEGARPLPTSVDISTNFGLCNVALCKCII